MIWYVLIALFLVFKILTSQRRCTTLDTMYDIGSGWQLRRVPVYDNSRLMALLMRLGLLPKTVDGWCPLSIHLPLAYKDTSAEVLAHEIAHIPDQMECGWTRFVRYPERSLRLIRKHGYHNSPLEKRAHEEASLILQGKSKHAWVDLSVFAGMKK